MNRTATATQPCHDFLTWQAAVQAADVLRRELVGRRVQMISHVRPECQGPKGEIRRVTAGGFEVSWENADGPGRTVSSAHPDDVVFI